MSFNFPTTAQSFLDEVETDLDLKKDTNTKRISAATSIIESYNPDIIGFQETHQEDIDSFFKHDKIQDTYSCHAPSVGAHAGDKNAIFYRKNVFTVINKGILYLNEKQEKGHNSWDDSHERACSWLCLEHKVAAVFFFVYNAHLGLKYESIIKGSKQVADAANKSKTQQVCSFIIGDFNADSAELNYLTKSPYDYANLKRATREDQISGPSYTYTGYDNKSKETPDHIFATLINRIRPMQFKTIDDKPHNTRPSDHFPIMATVELLK